MHAQIGTHAPPAWPADVPASPLPVDDDPDAPDDDAPGDVSPCEGSALAPARPRSRALRGAAVRARRLGAVAAVLPAVPTRRTTAAPRRLPRAAVLALDAPRLAVSARPRPLGPDRLRDGGDAAPGPPVAGRTRPSP